MFVLSRTGHTQRYPKLRTAAPPNEGRRVQSLNYETTSHNASTEDAEALGALKECAMALRIFWGGFSNQTFAWHSRGPT